MKIEKSDSSVNQSAGNGLTQFLTRQALAQWLSCSIRKIDEMREKDGLPFLKLGRQVLFELESVKAWLETFKRTSNVPSLEK